MNSLLGLAVLFAWGLSQTHGSLLDLHQMVTEATGKNAFLFYTFYGCHCGLGARGQPKDATDRCCKVHHACYDKLLNQQCDAASQPYRYSWKQNKPFCEKGFQCAHASCKCDRSLALCLRRNVGSYNYLYQFFSKDLC
ncbi:PA2GA Phospholipase, partial [Daphoenositta chrysoptera]|nr:PA2GA Phospholipase [Daphoenositta chrysoptera]